MTDPIRPAATDGTNAREPAPGSGLGLGESSSAAEAVPKKTKIIITAYRAAKANLQASILSGE